MGDIVNTLIGAAIGAAITWIIAHWYYKRAGKELREEAEKLGKLNSIILHVMEDQGWANLVRDSAGHPLGRTLSQPLRAEYHIQEVPKSEAVATIRKESCGLRITW